MCMHKIQRSKIAESLILYSEIVMLKRCDYRKKRRKHAQVLLINKIKKYKRKNGGYVIDI